MSDRANGQAREAWKAGETTYDDRAHDVRAPQWEEAVAASAAGGAMVAAPDVPADAADDDQDEPLAADEVTGNLRRYARWQWKDYWQRRGLWLAGAAMFGVWLISWIARHDGPGQRGMDAASVEFMAHVAFALGGFLAALLGTGGLVAREREHGLQRFLFAKPVNIVRYYLQGFAINSVGSLLVVFGAVLLAALALPSAVSVVTMFAVAAMVYATTSGVVFLASTLLRWDAPVAAAWLAAGTPITAAALNGWWWALPFMWLFPHGPAAYIALPMILRAGDVQSLGQILPAILSAGLVGTVYGLLCFLAGVAVLRRRSIQT